MAEPSIWDYQAVVSNRARRQGSRGWTKRVICQGMASSGVDALLPAQFSAYPGDNTATTACRYLMDTDVDYDWMSRTTAGGGPLAMAVLYYRPMMFNEWLEAHPNKAVLIGESGIYSRKVNKFGSYMLSGQDPSDADGKTFWSVVSGQPRTSGFNATYTLYAVTNNRDTYFYPFVSRVGCYNESALPGFPLTPLGSAAAQWLLTGIKCKPLPSASRLFTLTASFMLNTETGGWAAPCVSQNWKLEGRKIDVKDSEGTVIDTRTVQVKVPGGTTNTVNLIGGDDTAFTVLAGMLSASWADLT